MLNRSLVVLLCASQPFVRADTAGAQDAHLDVDARVTSVEQAYADSVALTSIGTSRQGRRIPLLTIAAPEGVPADERPALLLVAGTQGDREVDVLTALGVAEVMAARAGELLETSTLYVVPSLNRDGLSFHLNLGRGMAFGRAPTGGDADRDGRAVEDPGEDLNGDGLITMMRVYDQGPGSEIELTHLADGDDPRLNATPDAEKGQVAQFALLIEGVDDDGDGKFNEDGPGGSGGGGIDLDMNFPAHWPEHEDGAGAYPLSDPQALALARWLLERPNVVAVLTFGPHDTLATVPPSGKYDEVGRVPVGIEKDDEAHYKSNSKIFGQITRMTKAPERERAGSLTSWAYAHLGLFSFSTPVWVRPDLLKAEDEGEGADGGGGEKADGQEAAPGAGEAEGAGDPERVTVGSMTIELTPEGVRAAMSRMQGMSESEREELFRAFQAMDPEVRARMQQMMRGGGGDEGGDEEEAAGGDAGRGGKKKGKGEDAEWLAYSDEQRAGEGFVEWKAFEHPQLGRVEIGGFVPGFRINPPEEEYDRLIDEQARFVEELMARLPRLEEPLTRAEREGAGVWRVSVRLSNAGVLPTRSAIGVKSRRLAPEVVVLDVADEAILAGSKVRRIDAIAGSGGFEDVSWLVAAEDGSSVEVEIRSPVFGLRRVSVPLVEEGR